jgi:hypothetical protein
VANEVLLAVFGGLKRYSMMAAATPPIARKPRDTE